MTSQLNYEVLQVGILKYVPSIVQQKTACLFGQLKCPGEYSPVARFKLRLKSLDFVYVPIKSLC